MDANYGAERRVNFDDRLQRLEVDVAVMKADHVQIKNDMRESRTLLDKMADSQVVSQRNQTKIQNTAMATLISTLLGALGVVLWQVVVHGLKP